MHFINRCSIDQIISRNTSINDPKSAHNKPFNGNLSKPIPNKSTESCDQKTRYFDKLTSMSHNGNLIEKSVLQSRKITTLQ